MSAKLELIDNLILDAAFELELMDTCLDNEYGDILVEFEDDLVLVYS